MSLILRVTFNPFILSAALMLNVVMLSVVILNVVILSVTCKPFIPSAVMLNVAMLIAVAPQNPPPLLSA